MGQHRLEMGRCGNSVQKLGFALAIVTLIGACFLCVGVGDFGLQLLVRRCLVWDCAPSRSIRAIEMSIPEDKFPDGTVYGPLLRDDLDGSSEKANQTVFLDQGSGTAVFTITRWAGFLSAKEDFQLETKLSLRHSGDSPASVSYGVLSGADESVVYCGTGVYRCEMAARYAEYVVTFSADMAHGISADDFQGLCQYIDGVLTEVVK